MLKSYFHNNKFKNENKKIFTQSSKINIKRAVDINILLNRVKSEERNELKKKIIFFSFTTFALSLFGTFIAIIK
jgi:cytochrome c biogenesis factor|tara:strand:+ start:480 stop:701 length:222 start_codon:yes stop_codon:yes gene_type:complete